MVLIYSLIAIIIILIPEWIATSALSLISRKQNSQIDFTHWSRCPELLIKSMNIYSLRKIANELKITGYSSESKNGLQKLVFSDLRRKNQNRIAKQKRKTY